MTSQLAPQAAAGGPSLASAATDPSLAAWRSFIQAHARLFRRLDEELQASHGLSLAEYDALVQLAGAPGRRLRMSVLADRVLLSRSGITRLVDRLVADGMVERSACSTDARGAEAALTPAGVDRLRAAAVTHLDGVRRYFLDVIPEADRAVIARSLDNVTDGLGCRTAGVGRRGVRDPGRGLTDATRPRGRVLAGTSGFAYPGWTPRFYPVGLPAAGRLAHYAARLPACELNGTFYARPAPDRLDAWREAVPPDFRFVVKAQRGGSIRALYGDPAASVPWLTEHLPRLGDRLGAVLFRVPTEVARNDGRLAGLLEAWPAGMRLVVEAQHPSWHVDETFAALRAAGRGPVRDGPRRHGRAARHPPDGAVPLPAAPSQRVRRRRARRLGATAGALPRRRHGRLCRVPPRR